MIDLLKPKNYEDVTLQTVEQKYFLKSEDVRSKMSGDQQFKWYNLSKDGIDCTVPEPVRFLWKDSELNDVSSCTTVY